MYSQTIGVGSTALLLRRTVLILGVPLGGWAGNAGTRKAEARGEGGRGERA